MRILLSTDPAGGREGVSPLEGGQLAELLRQEVHGRGWTPRASALSRVHRTVSPMGTVELDVLASICQDLVRGGDLVLADGGYLGATPLRVVPIGAERWCVFASAPSGMLDELLPGKWLTSGHRRVRAAAIDMMEAAVSESGGSVVSSKTWAGFDRTPPADGAFLEGLDRRLTTSAAPAMSLDEAGALEWRAWIPHAGGMRWRRTEAGQLWRARNARFRWHRAWTAGASPAAQPFLSLDADEAARACFAVARRAEVPLGMRLADDPAEESVRLTLDGWLPRAEYRFLALHGQRVEGSTWRIDGDSREAVSAGLAARLGLEEVS